MTQVLMTENQIGDGQMMEEVTEHVGMNYSNTLDFWYVAQTVNDFLFPWKEEMWSVDNLITIWTRGLLGNNDTSELHHNHYNLFQL